MSEGNGAWEFDWNAVTRGEMLAFDRELRAMRQKAADADAKGEALDADADSMLFPISVKVVKRWPYDHRGKPDDVNSYNKLGMGEFTEWYNRFWATFPRRHEPGEVANGG